MRHDLVEAGLRRHYRHPRSGLDEQPKDVALVAIIDGHDVRAGRVVSAYLIAFAPLPLAPGPALDLQATDLLRQVHAFEARPVRGQLLQAVEVEISVDAVRNRDCRRPLLAHQARQGSRVDAGNADPPPPSHPVAEALVRSKIARLGHGLPD